MFSQNQEMYKVLSADIEKYLKLLLETKHLYQNQMIIFTPFEVILQRLIENGYEHLKIKENETILRLTYDKIINQEHYALIDIDEAKPRSIPKSDSTVEYLGPITFDAPRTIKQYCIHCKESNPYNIIFSIDYTPVIFHLSEEKEQSSIFLLAYQCQLCKRRPEFYLIQLENRKFSTQGRSPIEMIDISRTIPKTNRKYFSDSIIAYNSGQVLAGKFLLRTFIEQHLRLFSNDFESTDIEQLSKDYNRSLDQKFVESFPSLYSIYDNLSIDIHKADETEQGYIDARKNIELHFEGKATFDKLIKK